ncbi:MAG: T9SS type A sorting domain-containing protein [Paludibacteraceae bacterium]|nr:T9SS type A sorting domain-containing protein [Paludibacteraceae bacterium]
MLLAFISYMSAMAAVSLDNAKAKVKNYVENTLKLDSYGLLYAKNSMTKITLLSDFESVSVPSNSWAFFVDKVPGQDWAHPCAYIFVSKSNGTINVKNAQFPPKDRSKWDIVNSQNMPNVASDAVNPSGLINSELFPNKNKVANKCYAVIISGGADKYNNYPRYWNNCSMVYQMLRNIYGYKRENIYTLIADGKDSAPDINLGTYYSPNVSLSSPLDLDGDGNNDINYSATKSNIATVFNTLKNKMTASDELFIYTTDHGASDGSICLWNQRMSPSEFAAEVNKVDFVKNINIVMVQCFSGAHIPALSKTKRTIITAANSTESAWSAGGISGYGYFSKCWVEAMAGYSVSSSSTINADTDEDKSISMLESYQYALAHDVMATSGSEHPQYWSDGCLGERYYLDGPLAETENLCCTLSSSVIRKAHVSITSTTKISNANVQYQSYGRILLKNGFKVSKNANFKAKILACNSFNTDNLRSINIPENYDDEYEFDPEITDLEDVVSEDETIEIYPNPTNGIVYIKASEETINSITVSNMTGKVLVEKAINADQAEIDLSSYNKGIYLVKVVTENDSYIEKVVLK